jgi:hypothetical protein
VAVSDGPLAQAQLKIAVSAAVTAIHLPTPPAAHQPLAQGQHPQGGQGQDQQQPMDMLRLLDAAGASAWMVKIKRTLGPCSSVSALKTAWVGPSAGRVGRLIRLTALLAGKFVLPRGLLT